VLEIVLFAGSSLLLYHLGFGFLLFLIPFQALAVRKGTGGMFASQAVMLAGLAAIRIVRVLRGQAGEGAWLMLGVELGIVAVLLLALAVVNLPALSGQRAVFRLLIATAAAGLLFTPLALALSRNRVFLQEMEGLFAAVSQTMKAMLAGTDETSMPWIGNLLDTGTLMKMSGEYVMRSFVVDSLALIGLSWWAGTASGERSLGMRTTGKAPHLAAFRLPFWFVWLFIASWAAVAADLALGLAGFSYVAWNIGLVMLLLYGIQGMAIVRFLFEKYHVGTGWWVLLLVGLGILLASPRLNIIFLFGIPLLGVSEQWVTYRIPERSE